MLESFTNYFKSDTVVVEPGANIANIEFGNGFPESMRTRIMRDREAGTATYLINDCPPVTVECDKVLAQTIKSDNVKCPSSFDAICHYEKGEYSIESGLKVEKVETASKSWFSWGSSESEKVNKVDAPVGPTQEELEKIEKLRKLNEIRRENAALEAQANKSFFQQGLEWLGVANFLDYNQDGHVSLDDAKDAATEHPYIAAALAVAAIPFAYIAGKTAIGAVKGAGSASKDITVASVDAALFIPKTAYTTAFGEKSNTKMLTEPKKDIELVVNPFIGTDKEAAFADLLDKNPEAPFVKWMQRADKSVVEVLEKFKLNSFNKLAAHGDTVINKYVNQSAETLAEKCEKHIRKEHRTLALK